MISEIDRNAIIREELHRRTVRRSMTEWSKLCGYEPAKVHAYVIDKLEQVVLGKIRRLAIALPPGSAKSTYSSVLFPPWYLAQSAGKCILTCSHSVDLAESFGRRCRNFIDLHGNTLGYQLSHDSQAAGKWATTNGGEYFCAGVGGRIAGRRADLGLIDDPIGSKQDAYSDQFRKKMWDWYQYDFRTRLKPDASVILIQTTWHEDDLIGKLLNTDSGEPEEWTVIRLPLLATENDPLGRKPGEVIWPEYFNEKMVADAQKDQEVFQCLYQQNPLPEEGNFFKREWIDPYVYTPEQLPQNLRFYCASDHAVSLRQEADLTCLMPVGVDSDDNIWVLPDTYWEKADSQTVVEEMIRIMRRHRPITWWAEKGHISKSIGPFLSKRQQETGTYTYVEEANVIRDKVTRAQSIRARMKMGKVKFPGFARWFTLAKKELLSFPGGKHDDFVDALSHIGMGLDTIVKPKAELPQEIHTPPSLSSLTLKWLKTSDKYMRRYRERVALSDN